MGPHIFFSNAQDKFLPRENIMSYLIYSYLFLRNEQYYEAIMGIWNQLYINIKSLISWQYCVKDIGYINSLTVSMVNITKNAFNFLVVVLK